MFDVLLRRCRLKDAPELWDIALSQGQIVRVEPVLEATAAQELDVQGKLVTPPLVESHIHLDSAFTAGTPRWNQSGVLFEGIEIWGEYKQNLSLEDVKARARRALQAQAAQGVLFVRSHADVSEAKLIALQALLELREEVKDWISLQVVAFPQDGLYGAPQNEALLEEALKLGADVVGGIPHYELTREDGVRSVQRIFELAQQYDRLIDIHCDEIDDDQSRFLEVVAACAIRSGLGKRVTASHTTAFHSYNNAYAAKLMGFLHKSQINFIANPLINITLQGRTDTYPKRRGVTRVKELNAAGLNVSLGHDCVMDPWYSLGTGNMLACSHMAVHVCQMTGRAEIDACFDMVTVNGAKTLNLGDAYGIAPGRPANLVVLDATDPFDAIRRQPVATHVFSRGRLLVHTEPPQVQWQAPAPVPVPARLESTQA